MVKFVIFLLFFRYRDRLAFFLALLGLSGWTAFDPSCSINETTIIFVLIASWPGHLPRYRLEDHVYNDLAISARAEAGGLHAPHTKVNKLHAVRLRWRPFIQLWNAAYYKQRYLHAYTHTSHNTQALIQGCNTALSIEGSTGE